MKEIKSVLKLHEQEFPYDYNYTIDGTTAYFAVPVFYVDNRYCDIYSGYDFCYMRKEGFAHRDNDYTYLLQLLLYIPWFIITYPIRILLKKPHIYKIDLRETEEIHAKQSVEDDRKLLNPGPKDITIKISKTSTYDYCIEELDSFIEFCIDAKNKGATQLSPPPQF